MTFGLPDNILSIEAWLNIREAFNIAVGIAAPVLCVLLGRYVVKQIYYSWSYCKQTQTVPTPSCIYRELNWQAKASLGWFFVCFAETAHSWLVWEVIHTFSFTEATYGKHVIPLSATIAIIMIGLLSIISHLTPDSIIFGLQKRFPKYPKLGRHVLWVPTLLVIMIAWYVNFTVLDRTPAATDEYITRELPRQPQAGSP